MSAGETADPILSGVYRYPILRGEGGAIAITAAAAMAASCQSSPSERSPQRAPH